MYNGWNAVTIISKIRCGGVRGVIVIAVGNGHGNKSSNPGPG